MPDQAQIESFVKEYGFKPVMTKSEMKALPELLFDGEKLLGLIEGNLMYMHNKKEAGIGILFATDQRIVFYRKSIIGTTTKEEYPLHKISTASTRKGLLLSSIVITAAGNDVEINNLGKKEAEKLGGIISQLINTKPQQATTTTIINQASVGDELMKLAQLKEQGILTEEEFQEQKRKLLGK